MSEPTDRFREILRKLLDKSRKGEVHWIQVQKPTTFFELAPDAQSKIRVGHFSPEGAPDWGIAEFEVNGDVIARITAEDDGKSEDYALLNALWQDAHRYVFGWDKVLQKLETALQSEGVVGIPF
jgi:hypothetical protein